MRLILAAATLLMAVGSTGAAAQQGDAEEGLKRSAANCARCHVVASGVGTGTDGAPPFKAIANHLKRTEPQLRAFLSRPHGRMPDFVLTREEIADYTAYILSLRMK